MRAIRCVGLFVVLVLMGCTSGRSTTQPAMDGINADKPPEATEHFIRIEFKTFECGCSLGQIEFALLSLPNVGRVQWAYHLNRAHLILIGLPGPTDDQIRDVLAPLDLPVKKILRP